MEGGDNPEHLYVYTYCCIITIYPQVCTDLRPLCAFLYDELHCLTVEQRLLPVWWINKTSSTQANSAPLYTSLPIPAEFVLRHFSLRFGTFRIIPTERREALILYRIIHEKSSSLRLIYGNKCETNRRTILFIWRCFS